MMHARLPRASAVRPQRASRACSVRVNALFGLFAPKQTGSSVKAQELTKELVSLAANTAAGTRASPQIKDEIEKLVSPNAQCNTSDVLQGFISTFWALIER